MGDGVVVQSEKVRKVWIQQEEWRRVGRVAWAGKAGLGEQGHRGRQPGRGRWPTTGMGPPPGGKDEPLEDGGAESGGRRPVQEVADDCGREG